MSTDNEVCSICEQHPEDILMLECTHDLCVNCAAEIYAKVSKKTSIFVCEICLAQTVLDRETIQCLESAALSLRRQQRPPQNMPVASIPALPPAPPRNKHGFCTEHK